MQKHSHLSNGTAQVVKIRNKKLIFVSFPLSPKYFRKFETFSPVYGFCCAIAVVAIVVVVAAVAFSGQKF